MSLVHVHVYTRYLHCTFVYYIIIIYYCICEVYTCRRDSSYSLATGIYRARYRQLSYGRMSVDECTVGSNYMSSVNVVTTYTLYRHMRSSQVDDLIIIFLFFCNVLEDNFSCTDL